MGLVIFKLYCTMSLSKLFKSTNTFLLNINSIPPYSSRLSSRKSDDQNHEIPVVIKEKEKNADKSDKGKFSVRNILAKQTTHEKPIKEISANISDTLKKDKDDKNQDETLMILNTERGKEASVRSKLSKAYSKILKKRIALTSTGLNLSVQIDKDQQPSYDIPPRVPPLRIPKIQPEIEKIPPFLPDFDIKIEPDPTNERPVRQEPGKVIWGVIPEEWLHLFLPKTGVTGFYTFIFTFGTFLVSKEIYVLEHNFYNGLAMLILCWGGVKWIGPHVAEYLDKEIDKYEETLVQRREEEKQIYIEALEDEAFAEYQLQGNLLLIDAKRENVALQLEDEYRKRQMHVYEEVKRILDYQVEVAQVYKKIHHKNLLEYVLREVSKAATPDMHDKVLNYSIDNLLAELKKENQKK